MKILLKDVKLNVRIRKEFGQKITANIDVPQRDCLSPILFTLYTHDAGWVTVNAKHRIENIKERVPVQLNKVKPISKQNKNRRIYH